MIEVRKKIYRININHVIINKEASERFTTETGFVLDPILFAIFIDNAIK